MAASMPTQPDRLAYTIRELAIALGICESTAERWVYGGLVPSVRLGGKRLIPADELYRLLHPPAKSGTCDES